MHTAAPGVPDSYSPSQSRLTTWGILTGDKSLTMSAL